MGFNNSILGGVGNLIRQYIQSPDFVTGVSGWQIAKDGSAEFNDITARGDLTGSTLLIPPNGGPGTGIPYIIIDSVGIRAYTSSGNLVLKIASNLGVLQSSNVYSLPNGDGYGYFTDGAVGFVPESVVGNAIRWIFDVGTFGGSSLGVLRSTANPDTYRFSNGRDGGYYHEEWFLNNQSIPNNADTILTGQSNYTTLSDYGTGWLNAGTGIWTPPVSSIYTINVFAGIPTVAATRWYLQIVEQNSGNILGGVDILAATTSAYANVSIIQDFVNTERVAFHIYQNSGAARVVKTVSPFTGYITIHRHL